MGWCLIVGRGNLRKVRTATPQSKAEHPVSAFVSRNHRYGQQLQHVSRPALQLSITFARARRAMHRSTEPSGGRCFFLHLQVQVAQDVSSLDLWELGHLW